MEIERTHLITFHHDALYLRQGISLVFTFWT